VWPILNLITFCKKKHVYLNILKHKNETISFL
jgi:hypothetical protein